MQEKILQESQERFADHQDGKIAKNVAKTGANLRKFKESDLVITVRKMGSKLDYRWQGPHRVIGKLFANVYEIEDLRTKKKVNRDVTSLRSFICPEGVNPLEIAAQDEGEYVVRSIAGRRLKEKNNNKTHWYFSLSLKMELKTGFLTWR